MPDQYHGICCHCFTEFKGLTKAIIFNKVQNHLSKEHPEHHTKVTASSLDEHFLSWGVETDRTRD